MRALFVVFAAIAVVLAGCSTDSTPVAPSSATGAKIVTEETSTPDSVWDRLKAEGKYSTVGTPLEAFLQAAAAGDSASVAAFVDAGINKEGQALVVAGGNGRERTALHAAAAGSHLVVVKYLVGQGASVSSLDANGATPLHAAVASTDANGATPLWRAVTTNNLAVVQYLVVEQGADVNVRDAAGETPLHYTAAYGNFAIAQVLLARGATLLAKTPLGKTAKNIAFEVGHTPLAELLKTSEEGRLRNAARNGWLDTARECIEAGVDVNSRPAGTTPLQYAAFFGHLEVVQYLVEQGADVRATLEDPPSEKTAKDLALDNGHTAVAEYLESVGG